MHQVVYRFHKFILILSILLTLVAILLAARLKLDPNLFSLLPSNNPSVSSFFEVAEKIGFQSLLIALVEAPPGDDPTKTEVLIDLLAKNFSESQLIREVEYRSEERDVSSLLQSFMAYFPLFLKTRDLEKLTQKLSDTEIHRQVRENKKLLMTPFSIAAKELVHADPLGLRDLLESNITVPTARWSTMPYRGYYRTKEGGTYFLFLKPTNPPQDINFSKKLMKQVRHLEKMSLSEFTKEFGQGPKQTRISYAGGYPIAVQDEASTKRDIKVTLLTSFLGVMILFGLSFRTARILFYVGTPLAAGFLWTLGFAGLAFRNLNILTCIFSCVLIGLGVDFAIHIVNRYFDQDKAGADVLQRLQKTYEEAGTGIIIGAITTSAAFYSIAISDFRGFRELALLTGTGVLFCLLAMFFLLPSLLVYFANETDPMRRVTIAGFGLQPLLNLLQRYPRGLLIATFVTVCILAILGARVDFDDNLKNFRPTDHETLHLQDKITGWLGGSTSEIFLVAQEESEEEVMETNTLICDALEKLEASGMIAGTRSISKYFPSPSQQRENMEFIRQNRDVFDMERIKRTFNEALKENGFERIGLYDGYLENLSRAFSAEEIVLPSSLQDTELGRLMKLFVFQKGGHSKAVTYIVPPKDLWSRADTAEFRGMIIRNLEANGVQRESFSLTGASLLTGDLKELIIRNLRSSLWLAGLTIILVLFIYYRSLLPLVFSILPLTTGLAILVGTMVILGCDFNFFNVIVLPMIVGIGIDDGVHFTNTYRRLDHGDMLQPMSRTGRAVVLTSLTTLVGFGSISLSHYPGLKSMGYVAVIGISACLFASVVLLPGIFSILRKPR